MSTYYNINKKHPSFVVGNDKSSYKAGNSIHPFFYIVYGLWSMGVGVEIQGVQCIKFIKEETKLTKVQTKQFQVTTFKYIPTYVVVLGIDFIHGHSVIHNMLLLIDLAKVHSY